MLPPPGQLSADDSGLRELGRRRVGSLRSAPLALAIFALIVVAYAAFVVRLSVNVPIFDQWSDLGLIAHSYRHLTLGDLWAQHNENRMLFPNLVVLGLSRTTHFNIVVEQYLSALLLFASITLIVVTHVRRWKLPLLAYVPVVVLMLSVAQYENSLWGFQIAWYMILFSVAVALWALGRRTVSWPLFALAACAAVVGSYSSLQGLLIWVVGAMLLRGKPRAMMQVWVVAAVVTGVVYFIGYQRNPYSSQLPSVETAFRFFFLNVGDVVGAHTTGTPLPVLVLGLVITALGVVSVVAWANGKGDAIGAALVVFGLLFALTVTLGRGSLGLQLAGQSRYVTFNLLTVVGIYLSACTWHWSHRPEFRWVAGVVVALAVLLGTVNGIPAARSEHGQRLDAQRVLSRPRTHTDDQLADAGFPGWKSGLSSPGFIRSMVNVAQAHKLTLYNQ